MKSLLLVMFWSVLSQGSYAAELRKEETNTYAFAVPDGGWSSCQVHIIYTENYVHSSLSHRSTFNRRGKWYTGTYAYATERPNLGTGAAVIMNSSGNTIATYTSWRSVASIFPSGVDALGYYENSNSIELADTTSDTGQINYSITCSGGYPASYIKNIRMNLSTR